MMLWFILKPLTGAQGSRVTRGPMLSLSAKVEPGAGTQYAALMG